MVAAIIAAGGDEDTRQARFLLAAGSARTGFGRPDRGSNRAGILASAYADLLLVTAVWLSYCGVLVANRLLVGEPILWWVAGSFLSGSVAGIIGSLLAIRLMIATETLPLLGRLALLALAAFACALLHAFVSATAWIAFSSMAGFRTSAELFSAAFQSATRIGFFVSILTLTASSLLRVLAERNASEWELVQAQDAAQQAQIAALRFQLNPHFLFNTLNALSALVVTGRSKEAEQMIERIADFLRISLDTEPEHETTLADELDYAVAYLDIEKVRFGERMNVLVSCPRSLQQARVPGLILQPLVENAVKHGVARSREPVTIAIRVEAIESDLVVTVENSGPHQQSATERRGIGIENTRRRIEALYGTQGSLDCQATPAGGYANIVRVPLKIAEGADA